MKDIQLFNKNCFDVFPTLEDKSINLFVLDLPYGQTACKWDSVIDLEEMWKHIKRIMKPNAILVFFCTAKFGYTLIHSNPKWFKYDLIWKKSRKVGFLSANKQPLRQHELMYVFNDKPVTHSKKENQEYSTYNPQKTDGKPFKVKGGKSKAVNGSLSRGHEVISKEYENKGDRHPTSIIDHENMYVFDATITDDIDRTRNKDLREYAEKVKKFINKPLKEIEKKLGNMGVSHFYSFKGSQFGLCTNKTYNELIKEYNIDEMEEFLEYEILESLWEGNSTYNPQKTEGKPYKCKQGKQTNLYGIEEKDNVTTENKGDRHPTSIIPEYEGDSILVYKNPHKTIHRTQKPVELLEWLIKTYSNEGDTLMDFTMGSGTAGIGCINTKRKFIGVEMDEEIFKLAEDRIENHKKNM